MADGGAGSSQEASLVKVLEDLRSLSGEVDAGYVVSGEGRLLASTVKDAPEVDRERLGAMLSALSGLSERRARERGHERAEQVRVRAPEGYVLLSRLSGGFFDTQRRMCYILSTELRHRTDPQIQE